MTSEAAFVFCINRYLCHILSIQQPPADISIQIENDELLTKKLTFLSNHSVGRGGIKLKNDTAKMVDRINNIYRLPQELGIQ